MQANINLDSRLGADHRAIQLRRPDLLQPVDGDDIYDSLGNPHTYSMYFVKAGVNAWHVYAT
jgi:hypothetical protein